MLYFSIQVGFLSVKIRTMHISTSDIQDIAVRCSRQLTNHGISLNESLAKEASVLGLNSEQVKRAIEATNTISYLATLEKSAGERTTEFPLADYNEVIRAASIPDSLSLQKEASFKDAPAKVEATTPVFHVGFPDLSEKESHIGLHKHAQINDRALEDAIGYSNVVASKLIKLATEIKKDPQGLEKLSAVIETDFEKISSLVFGEFKAKRDTIPAMFKQAELKSVTDMAALYKEATELVFQIAKRKELQKQANEKFMIEKKAGLLSSIGNFAGKAIGGIVKAPFKAVGAIGGAGLKAVNNAVADTGLGQAAMLAKKPISTGVKRTLAVGSVAAGAALDASMYTPKTNPNTGNGGDVWAKLHSND
jgi:hypothetical protein